MEQNIGDGFIHREDKIPGQILVAAQLHDGFLQEFANVIQIVNRRRREAQGKRFHPKE